MYVGHSLLHAGNVPIIFNPVITHISPQFHVVFDDQFATVTTNSTELPDDFYIKLHVKAKWAYNDKYAKVDDLYHFDTFWSALPLNVNLEK
jgi:hypothetical protein